MQTGQHVANVGSRLKRVKARKAPSEKPAFQPYRGKPAVRNDRGDRGNVGIMRSPVRASILPDRGRATASGDPVGWEPERCLTAQATAPILDSTEDQSERVET